MSVAEAYGYDVLVTCDKSMRFEQNWSGRRIAVVFIMLNDWDRIEPVADAVREAVESVHPGELREVEVPSP